MATTKRKRRRIVLILAINVAILAALLTTVEIVLRLTEETPAALTGPPPPRVFEQVQTDDGHRVWRNRLADPNTFPRFGITQMTAGGVHFQVEVPFAPAEFRVEKQPDQFRLFLLGSSPIYARRSEGEFDDLGAIISEQWHAAGMQTTLEIANCANKAFDQDTMRLLLGELVEYDPDLVLVYIGNVSPAINFGQDRELIFHSGFTNPLIRAMFATRLFRDFVSPLVFGRGTPVQGRDLMTGARTYGNTDARALAAAKKNLQEIYRHKTGETLREMADIAEQAGVPLAFYTLLSNLYARPMQSEFDPATIEQERQTVRRLLQEAEQSRDPRSLLEEALAIDDTYAETHFRLGMKLYQDGKQRRARKHLRRAVEHDGAASRLDFIVNPELERLRKRGAIELIDLRSRMDDNPITSRRYFSDQTHFNHAGMKLVADTTIQWLQSTGRVSR
ncbi:MAG: tetratricopeptide repeat protein [Candidatus Lernaella stagnicola]|nr:tetratricopeptide repeat protein [Candidatus Lernaella stagnicola]